MPQKIASPPQLNGDEAAFVLPISSQAVLAHCPGWNY